MNTLGENIADNGGVGAAYAVSDVFSIIIMFVITSVQNGVH